MQANIVNNMSYASELKKEICNIDCNNCCYEKELEAIIVFKSEISIQNRTFYINLKTTSLTLSRRITFLLKKVFNITPTIIVKKQDKLDYKDIITLQIEDGVEILKEFNLIDDYYNINLCADNIEIINSCCKIAYLRGAFLARGSINNPNTNNYHLEIVCPNESQACLLNDILGEIGLHAHITSREKGFVLYLKKAEDIADFLRYVGASNMLFDYEDIRIKKDLNNYVNRITNCDVANEQKVFRTAQEQLKNIEVIVNNLKIEQIDERLLGAMTLRNRNPDDSLAELSNKSEDEIGYYISKSGLSHRFNEIKKLAIDISKRKEK